MRARHSLSLAVTLVLSACAAGEVPTVPIDSSTAWDLGSDDDRGGLPPDTGTPRDSGSPLDTGTSRDTGVQPDRVAPVDVGAPLDLPVADTGSAVDRPDAQAPVDSGCTASSQCSATPATPVCDRASGRCVPCSPSEDRCPSGQYCTAGFQCATGCRDDASCAIAGGSTTRCDLTRRACVECRSDTDCPIGSLCGTGSRCVAGCNATRGCPMGNACCASQCVAVASEVSNCGACANVCRAANGTPGCALGRCTVAQCNAGFGDCDRDASNGCEVDTRSATAHCGGCGTACRAGPNSTATCTAGRCGLSCAAGFGDCNGDPADGCETDLRTNASHCGQCANLCRPALNAAGVCRAGVCGLDCTAGSADCDGSAATGCEALLSGTANCGRCGNACTGQTPLCAASGAGFSCVSGCAAGQVRCGASCANTAADPTNCGQCGTTCPSGASATATCAAGQCGITCTGGRLDCNSAVGDGCETDPQNSVAHCGRCGNACQNPTNATAACRMGFCGVGTCTSGWADCDGLAANGCEVNLQGTVAHCGRCGGQCSSNNIPVPTCTGGVCGGQCSAGYADCNRDPSDGCETNLSTDPNHCGACGNRCSTGLCGDSIGWAASAAVPPRWQANGSTTWNATEGSAVLTPVQVNNAGTIFYQNPIVAEAFVATFGFRISGGTRADGMAFALQRTGASVVGRGGGGFGVSGLNGWAVEIDDFNNQTCGDANGNHIAVDTLEFCDTAQGLPVSLRVGRDLPYDILDGRWRTVIVTFAQGMATVEVEGTAEANAVRITNYTAGTPYWFGFGGATGGFASRHEVRQVRVQFPSVRCL